MYQLVLNTCGTSLLTNGCTPAIAKLIRAHSNAADWEAIPNAVERSQLQKHVEERKQLLLSSNEQQASELSAELNGLLAWKAQQKKRVTDRVAYLLATDTALGGATADLVKEWLEKNGWRAQLLIACGLRTDRLSNFRGALSKLTGDLHSLLNDNRNSGYRIIFNLTGGFKSVNGFLQAAASIYADESFYLFESSRELMTVPRLPLKFDAEAIAREHIGIFRRLDNNLTVSVEDAEGVPEIFLFPVDDVVALSEWGTLIWQNVKESLYRSRVWPSISSAVIATDNFNLSSSNQSPDLNKRINNTLDQLATYAESDRKINPKGLDAKPVTGQPPYYECDVDRGHNRIFMLLRSGSLELVEFGAALHKSKMKI